MGGGTGKGTLDATPTISCRRKSESSSSAARSRSEPNNKFYLQRLSTRAPRDRAQNEHGILHNRRIWRFAPAQRGRILHLKGEQLQLLDAEGYVETGGADDFAAAPTCGRDIAILKQGSDLAPRSVPDGLRFRVQYICEGVCGCNGRRLRGAT